MSSAHERAVSAGGGYAPVRALIGWIALAVALGALFLRYGAPTPLGGGSYLAGVYDRALESAFYQGMVLVFCGALAYALALRGFLLGLVVDSGGAPRWSTRVLGQFVGVSPRGAKTSIALLGPEHAIAPLRDVAALFPGVGFIGTVVGVSTAIGGLEAAIASQDLTLLIDGLRTAFDTTFIGLAAAIVLSLVIVSIDGATRRLAATDAPSRRRGN